jgi:hypothetical protein
MLHATLTGILIIQVQRSQLELALTPTSCTDIKIFITSIDSAVFSVKITTRYNPRIVKTAVTRLRQHSCKQAYAASLAVDIFRLNNKQKAK